MSGVVLNLEDENVRLVCKRIIALVAHCEKNKKPFPLLKNIAPAIGIMPWELQKYINTLITEEVIVRDEDPKKKRYLYVNN